MSSDAFTLFDIPTKGRQRCWSMNAWRTRILLNYKGLNYKTEWVEYPDIKSRLEQHVSPNTNGAQFTIPAIQMPSGNYVMDSYQIAEVIEQAHPIPPLALNTPTQLKFRDLMRSLMGELDAVYVPRVAQRLLGERSVPYFVETRSEAVGMPLYEYGEKHSDGCFEKAEPYMRGISALLNETASSGPLILGRTVSYADFLWAGILLFWKTLGEEEFEELMRRSADGDAHRKFLEALRPWTERDD